MDIREKNNLSMILSIDLITAIQTNDLDLAQIKVQEIEEFYYTNGDSAAFHLIPFTDFVINYPNETMFYIINTLNIQNPNLTAARVLKYIDNINIKYSKEEIKELIFNREKLEKECPFLSKNDLNEVVYKLGIYNKFFDSLNEIKDFINDSESD